MAQNTAIEWANIPGYTPRTWNPLAGCTRRSEECDLCYAAGMAIRLEAMANADLVAGRDPGGKEKYIGTARRNHAGRAAFVGVVNLDWEALDEPATWKKPSAVFVNSMSDLFHAAVPDRFILETFHAMRKTPQHIYMVLTKRPERMAEWTRKYHPLGLPSNIWCGTSIGLDAYTPRADYLRKVPAAVRFLSCEPLLSGLPSLRLDGIHQVIVGGESGTGARPMNPDWARNLRDQAQAAGVRVFMKQMGSAYMRSIGKEGKGGDWEDLPEDLRIREFPEVHYAI